METSQRTDDDEGGAGAQKLIPEWGVDGDDQVVLAGLAVVAVLALILGWIAWRGSGDDGQLGAVVEDVASASASGGDSDGDGDSGTAGGSDSGGSSGEAAGTGADVGAAGPTTTSEQATTTTEAATTTAAQTSSTAPPVGDVQAAVDPVPGSIAASTDGTVAVLDGFVANAAESREAEAAAVAVNGVTEVRNDLVLLEPAVTVALETAGVTGATAVGIGTQITVSGTIDNEDGRQPALDAAAAVEGVTDVVDDRLNVRVTADLNELPQVQFATNSAEILEASFTDLDAAAQLLIDTSDISIEIQGYTDIVGDEARNLALSQNRAEAVRTYLMTAGVDGASLSATGYGETEQFGDDLASNRLVRFQQIDG